MYARAVFAFLAAAIAFSRPAGAVEIRYLETPSLAGQVAQGKLPPIAERVPKAPLVVDLAGRDRTFGEHGGTIRTLVSKVRDLRYLTVYGYTRLVIYNEKLELVPDLLDRVENDADRVFTLVLREGHRWSDGAPFTTEDFRYYWEDVANNRELSPVGPPDVFIIDGEAPKVEVLDALRVRFSWSKPNPGFLPHLAQPRPNFIYLPAHYMKQFHVRYADKDKLAQLAAQAKLKGWAALHNRLDDPYEQSNPDMPSLGPWTVVTKRPATRFVFDRNPYYHRVDAQGRQLPYVDQIIVDIAAAGLFAAKANAGEVDLLARGLSMADAPVLKEGEKLNGYKTLLWPTARGSAYALYPNLTTNDPVWRALNRDVRFRRALSLAIDRRIMNNALLFGLGHEGNNTVAPMCVLFKKEYQTSNAHCDPVEANRLLDEIGLTKRDSLGFRLLSDGRRAEIIVEVDGEASDVSDALLLITEFWNDIGIKLFVKPQDRTILRKRAFAGSTVMVAGTGLDNALVTPLMPPHELAPISQSNLSWPKWGQYQETGGKAGEPVDMLAAKRTLELYKEWMRTADVAQKSRIWHEMLAIHAEQQWVIGTVSGDLQPIVVSGKLRNVPQKGVFSWEPGALLGIYRIDEFYYPAKKS